MDATWFSSTARHEETACFHYASFLIRWKPVLIHVLVLQFERVRWIDMDVIKDSTVETEQNQMFDMMYICLLDWRHGA